MSHLQEYNKIPFKEIKTEVIDQLKLNFAHDHLNADEFEKRLVAAEAAEEKGQLALLVQDLPYIKPDPEPKAQAPAPRSFVGTEVAINQGTIKENQTFVSIFSGVERKGLWRPAKKIRSLAVFGGFDLDLTKAELPPEGLTIDTLCVMGGGEITVPKGVNVEVTSIPIMGGVENKTDVPEHTDAPTIRIRSIAIMGGLEIRHKKKKKD